VQDDMEALRRSAAAVARELLGLLAEPRVSRR
jgi:hypothetical protein